MPTSPRKTPPRKRNAGASKHKAKRFRNAVATVAPARPRTPAATPARKGDPASGLLRFGELADVFKVLGGATVASIAGAFAVRWGFHPTLVSSLLGGAGGVAAWRSDGDLTKHLGFGAVSAAGSQLALLALNPRLKSEPAELPAPRPVPQLPAPSQAPSPPPTVATAKPRASDGLPPGMLDAALERARAELAVASDGYPPGYAPANYDRHTHASH